MALEQAQVPPPDVEYSFATPSGATPPWVRSPIKGFMRSFGSAEHDVLEAVISPIRTASPWVYSLACFQEAMAFGIGPVPTPRAVRRLVIDPLLRAPNLRAIVFWSEAGRRTIDDYGQVKDPEILQKSLVVYPAVKLPPVNLRRRRTSVTTLLFSGDFFRKGGAAVVDAFARVRRLHANLELIVCSSQEIDFETRDQLLRSRYLRALQTQPGIRFLGRVPRETLLSTVLPQCDVYLMPSYAEAFGFAVLEAMAYGLPVVTTNHFALPEMVQHDRSGVLIDIDGFDLSRVIEGGYVVRTMPADLHEHVTEALVGQMVRLVEEPGYAERLALGAIERVSSVFSFEVRNGKMRDIYRSAVA